ncbi:MAG TPA: HAMP domain-containing sensor histidine kinase [Deinococcales bacterium]|nr:HAMP domain-containing sensor histidine kinase [Deinococcales bacterium]
MRWPAAPRSGGELPDLESRLFGAQVLGVLVASTVLLGAADLSAPVFFGTHLREMSLTLHAAVVTGMREELSRGFFQALVQVLAFAAAIAVPVAVLTGLALSARLTRPISRAVDATQRIAEGFLAERLPLGDTRELAELAAGVNSMAAHLEDTSAHRKRLLDALEHELRTPLAGARGYAEGLADHLFAPDQAAGAILGELHRLDGLVEQVLLLERAEAGRIPVVARVEDLRECVLDTAAFVGLWFADKNLTVRTVVPESSVPAWIDPDRVCQVLMALLENARRHTATGGVVLTVGAAGDGVTVDVADTGEGVRDEDRPFIFERFYRGDGSRSRVNGETVGIGIGLTVARCLAEAMGGTLEALPAETGACFRLTLRGADLK